MVQAQRDYTSTIRGLDEVEREELAKNDFNISPSRYIHTSDAATYRPIAEIVKQLDAIEAEAREADRALREIFGRLGV
jgi:type I restriction enzyme M protein